MFAKTAVRALANRGEMPLSIEFLQAMDTDDVHVDYAAYAKNPDMGPMIDADTGEIVEAQGDDARMIENTEGQKADFANQRYAEPARTVRKPTQERKSAQADAMMKDRKADTQGVVSFRDEEAAPNQPAAKAPARAEDDRYIVLRDAILRDLDDSGDVEGIRGFYGEQLDDMALNARDVFEPLMAKMAQIAGVEE